MFQRALVSGVYINKRQKARAFGRSDTSPTAIGACLLQGVCAALGLVRHARCQANGGTRKHFCFFLRFRLRARQDICQRLAWLRLNLRYVFFARQRIFHCGIHRGEYFFLLRKFHLGLCRMDIDIHQSQRQINADTAVWEFSRSDTVAVCFFHRRLHQLGFDKSPVDKEMLIGSICARRMRFGNVAPHANAVERIFRHLNEIFGQLLAEHTEHGVLQAAVSRSMKHAFAVSNTLKIDFRMALGGVLHHRQDISRFGKILF